MRIGKIIMNWGAGADANEKNSEHLTITMDAARKVILCSYQGHISKK